METKLDIFEVAERLGFKCFIAYNGDVCVRKPDADKNDVMSLAAFLRFMADAIDEYSRRLIFKDV